MRHQLSGVLKNISAELQGLAAEAESLQSKLDSVGVIRTVDGTRGRAGWERRPELGRSRPELVSSLQSLDYVTQALQCLAIAVDGVAAGVSSEAAVDLGAALQSVWLSRLRSRLESREQTAITEGELELFDAA